MSALRILCVHRKPAQLEALKGVLEEDGYHVLWAADGTKALDVLSHQVVDGVVLNFDMEGPGGVMLRHRIQHQRPDMPMLLVDDVKDMTMSLKMFGACIN